jgi:Tfp pilus assembly protein PilF
MRQLLPGSAGSERFSFGRLTAIGAALVLLTLLGFWPVIGNGFINYDDDEYVTENPHVQAGLTLNGIRWALTATEAANWHPLTWVSHMADQSLFGADPRGHHLSSLSWHLANVVLLFLVLFRMTGAPWRSAAVAALFALHPLHVESVAWISERKDVSSAFFWILTLWAYARYADRPGPRRYLLVAAFLALGLACKPMLVSVPLVLLLLDFWPLDRLHSPYWPVVREKIPLVFLAAASCVVTLVAQQRGGAIGSFERLPLSMRLENAVVSYAGYLSKTIWPAGLSIVYPHPGPGRPGWQLAGAISLLAAISYGAIRARRRRPYFLVGWLWFLVTLVPVIGLVQVGEQAMADRYTYVPLVGPFVAMVWGAADLVRRAGDTERQRRISTAAVATASAAVLGILLALTRVQAGYWRDSETLFRHALEVTTANATAHLNLASALAAEGRIEEAVPHLEEAVRIQPRLEEAHYNLGLALAILDRANEANEHFAKALNFEPRLPESHNTLGTFLAKQGKIDEAIAHFEKAIAMRPEFADAHYNLGTARAAQQRWSESILHFERAVALRPVYPEARYNLGAALYCVGDYAQAWREVRLAGEQGYAVPPSMIKMLREKAQEPAAP